MDIFNTSESYFNNNTSIFNFKSPIDFNTAGLIFSLIVVLPENSYMIWLIVTGAGNGVASEIFSLNLSVCEIFFCLQFFLSLFCNTFPSLLLVIFLSGIPYTGRPLFQCLICVERYLAVIHPVIFLKSKPLRYRLICCTAAWIIIVITCLFSITGLINNNLFMCYSLCQALITLCVKLFCCVAVLRALKQSGPGEKGRERDKANHMKRRAFNTIVLIMMSLLLIYGAYLVAGFIFVLTQQFISMLWAAGYICFVLGGSVQPLLYLYKNGKLPFCKVLQSCYAC